RPSNIEKFTDGRFRPTQLAADAPPLEWTDPPRPQSLAPSVSSSQLGGTPALLLVHPEDLHPESLVPQAMNLKAAFAFSCVEGTVDWPFGDKARAFVDEGIADAAERLKNHYQLTVDMVNLLDPVALIEACRSAAVETVVTPYAPVGPVADSLEALERELRAEGFSLYRLRRDWDEFAWPFATKGFFPFKKKIPALLEYVGLQ
ncbi:MAG: DNA photolyase FAD-binding protein, partial [Pseudomonadota bacterium]